MARREPPPDVLRAIGEHLQERHGRSLAPGVVGAWTARASTTLIAWNAGEGDEGGASFRCRACEAGFDRFYTEVGCAIPSPRLVERIHLHFNRERHEDLRDDEIFHDENKREGTRASFIGATPSRGAQIVCMHCGPGLLIELAEPARGDARRIRYLLRTTPTLQAIARNGYTKKAADYVVAWDRGLLLDRHLREGANALRQARPRRPDQQRLRRQEALVEAVRLRQREGESATAALSHLTGQSASDPVAFLCALGASTPALQGEAEWAATPRDFAETVALHLGLGLNAPVLSGRTLRRYLSDGVQKP